MTTGPDIWGPHGWKFIHFIVLGYPNYPTKQDKETYKNFFLLFANIIPCKICSNHFKQNLQKHPLNDKTLNDKISLIKWSIEMHNEVNKANGKKIYSFDEGMKMIFNGNKPYNCSKSIKHFSKSIHYEWIIIIILIGIIIYLVNNNE
jgi:hypothetical protein